MELSIIIVNWNVREYLLKAVESIFKFSQNLSFEIIVVDNASNDKSLEALRNKFFEKIKEEKLVLIQNHKNLGFAKANNIGLREAKGDYIFFVNPDIEFVENSGKILLDLMKAKQEIALCTCTLLYGDKTTQPNVKNNPTLCSQILIALKLHHFSKAKCLDQYLRKDFDYQKEQEVKQVMGACVFTRKDMISGIKGWSEDYPLWWEDVDLCKRYQLRGQKIVYTPKTKIIHYEGKSFEQRLSLAKQKRFLRGMLTYFYKYHSKLAFGILLIISPLSLFLAFLTQIFKVKPRTQSKI